MFLGNSVLRARDRSVAQAKLLRCSASARDEAAQRRLREISERLTGVTRPV
ncbi:hypothetical protein [Sorangium cellulosum]|uniref:hypothetical protein n=1 Tax=Sorangium cellulosum TaxID=56 RepID=UPI000AF350C8|nr:hypothetical protein [Sorangium cellulosum]